MAASNTGDESVCRKFKNWWKDTKPTDVLSVVMTLVSLTVATVALVRASEFSGQQAEAAAPILAPGTPPAQRGKLIHVTTEYTEVLKRADRLYLDRSPKTSKLRGRFVVPLRNGGLGIALTIGPPVLVANCEKEPALLPEAAIRAPLGTYVLPSGESDQLGFLQPEHIADKVAVPGEGGFWYSFDYKHFGLIGTPKARPADLLIWYTDGAQRKLRWTCIQYIRTGHRATSETEWGVVAQNYGTRAMVDLETKTN